ncbi:hypothetical protein FBY22_3722 [Streptomyces sp. SLBN-31]|nr:hypothetical protein FBY22_3722 [Streptomyces sp. SLBN-31]
MGLRWAGVCWACGVCGWARVFRLDQAGSGSGVWHAHLRRCRRSPTIHVGSLLRHASARTRPRSLIRPDPDEDPRADVGPAVRGGRRADGEGCLDRGSDDCRQRGDGLHHAVQAVARMQNLALAS